MKYGKFILTLFVTAACVVLTGVDASAQFRTEAFTQQYNDDPAAPSDSTDRLFSLKEYFGGLRHENELKIGTMTAGSAVLIGGSQIYNRQYWKLPVVYGGIGAGVGLGIHFNNQYKATGDAKFKQYSTWSYIGAGLVWWGSLMDMTANFKSNRHPEPGRSTLYSLLLPGLGQIYNGEYWKVPFYMGGMATCVYFYTDFRRNYQRYKWIYDLHNSEDPNVEKPTTVSAETALLYRNLYRRYRDYAILGTALVYLLQVVDANVFAYMQDFEMDDDISLRIEPTLITPEFASAPPAPGFGLTLRF